MLVKKKQTQRVEASSSIPVAHIEAEQSTIKQCLTLGVESFSCLISSYMQVSSLDSALIVFCRWSMLHSEETELERLVCVFHRRNEK